MSNKNTNTNKTQKNQLGIKDFCEDGIRQATLNQSLKRNNSVRSSQESDQPHEKLEMENEEQPKVVITNAMIWDELKKVNMRINLQSKYLEKPISKFNQDLHKCMPDLTKEVSKASSKNDKVNNLEAKL